MKGLNDNQIPLKWKKHLVLPAFGLRTKQDLQQEIHRYKSVDELVTKIANDMKGNNNKTHLYTISLIKNSHLHKLPNVNVRNTQELKEFYDQYHNNTNFSEFWFCKKQAKKDQLFSVGRICFDTRRQVSNKSSLQNSQMIEQVWNTSHREIEHYKNNGTNSYLCASREEWGRRYNIKQLTVNKNEQKMKQQMVTQFYTVAKEIESNREKIEKFETYLRNLGVNQFSLEYLLEESRFLLIDWDSDNDLKVINELNFEEERE